MPKTSLAQIPSTVGIKGTGRTLRRSIAPLSAALRPTHRALQTILRLQGSPGAPAAASGSPGSSAGSPPGPAPPRRPAGSPPAVRPGKLRAAGTKPGAIPFPARGMFAGLRKAFLNPLLGLKVGLAAPLSGLARAVCYRAPKLLAGLGGEQNAR